MSNIDELHRRITAAMDRIGTGVEALAQSPGDAGAIEALEEEKLANAQLKERIRSLNDKHAAEIAELEARLEEMGNLDQLRTEMEQQAAVMSRLDTDLQRLRQANEQLRSSNAALREANEVGVGEPHLINKAMLAELEALRASRSADATETNAILTRLGPLLAKSGVLADGEDG